MEDAVSSLLDEVAGIIAEGLEATYPEAGDGVIILVGPISVVVPDPPYP